MRGDPLIVAPYHRDWRDNPGAWHYPVIHANARFEHGCIVQQGIRQATYIGASWLLSRVLVGHDAWIGDGCEIADNVVVGAHSVIGPRVRLGIGTLVKPGVTIGEGARTGIGAVVARDVPAGQTWVGNPARQLEQRGPGGITGWRQMRVQPGELDGPAPFRVIEVADPPGPWAMTDSEREGWERVYAARPLAGDEINTLRPDHPDAA